MPADISIVIPTFRRPEQLAEALASVLRQADVTLEVFVVDDCPNGSAHEVVKAAGDARVTYIRNPKPTGGFPSIVRNLAWPLATGKLVHFLDDDDMVPEGHYAAVKAAFERHPRVGLVFGQVAPFGTCGREQLEHERRYFARAAQNARRCARFGARFAFAGWMLFDSALLVCGAGIVRRDCVVDLKGFDSQMSLMEDTDFFCRLTRKFGAHFLNRVALHYRIGSPSLMHAPNPSPEQRRAEQEGARRVWANYRRDHGLVEFLALAAMTRLFLKYV